MAPYRLPDIPHLRLRATLVSGSSGQLPGYLGSTLRGAFGHALRRLVCAMGPEQPCATCPLRGPCVHTRLFETFLEGDPPPFLRGLPTAPRPYVFEPRTPLRNEPQVISAGDCLELDLLLFGQAVALQGYAVLALERMAERGLGQRHRPFVLQEVRHQGAGGAWQTGYRRGERPWSDQVAAAPLPAPLTSDGTPAAPERLTLRFTTPTRIQKQGELQDRPAFRPLAFAMLRRALELAHCHVPGAEVSWDFNGYLRQADAVRVTRTTLHWHDWTRYSNRQKAQHSMGGFVGEIDLEGDLAPFLPLLHAAETLHVGKGATFGLGKVEVVGT
ncbi:MAG TPA: CRISPR system precrRNA processing endoribonuclease RAMP protein Cas6 [Thermoanaerobaculia bacterium]|nr:CRISPR system precrRNA processing endoribonuclease RAMP protein Cas6 [Thermoanaerobaculia bacterium]